MMVKGQEVNFPLSGVTATFNQTYKELVLLAKTSDANKNSLQIQATANNFAQPQTYSTATARAFLNSSYEYFVLTGFRNACGQTVYANYSVTYRTGTTSNPVFTLTIDALDIDKHMFRGTFSGTYWDGCDKLEITDGQFHLPYTLKP